MSRGISHITVKNGEFIHVEDLDYICEQLKIIFDEQKEKNEQLKEELVAITDEKWKDEELLCLKEERDRAVSELRRGFGFSEEEINKVNSWKRAHSNNRHGARTNADRALRGNYSYEMTPTSIGTIKSCICETCRIKAIEKSDGDINKYRKLLEIYDAVFDISDYDNF